MPLQARRRVLPSYVAYASVTDDDRRRRQTTTTDVPVTVTSLAPTICVGRPVTSLSYR